MIPAKVELDRALWRQVAGSRFTRGPLVIGVIHGYLLIRPKGTQTLGPVCGMVPWSWVYQKAMELKAEQILAARRAARKQKKKKRGRRR